MGMTGMRNTNRNEGNTNMLVLGIIFLLLGLVLGVPVLWTFGVVFAVIGGVLWVANGAGRSWGRRWY